MIANSFAENENVEAISIIPILLGRLKLGDLAITMKINKNVQQSNSNIGLINKVDMVCLSPVGYGV